MSRQAWAQMKLFGFFFVFVFFHLVKLDGKLRLKLLLSLCFIFFYPGRARHSLWSVTLL